MMLALIALLVAAALAALLVRAFRREEDVVIRPATEPGPRLATMTTRAMSPAARRPNGRRTVVDDVDVDSLPTTEFSPVDTDYGTRTAAEIQHVTHVHSNPSHSGFAECPPVETHHHGVVDVGTCPGADPSPGFDGGHHGH